MARRHQTPTACHQMLPTHLLTVDWLTSAAAAAAAAARPVRSLPLFAADGALCSPSRRAAASGPLLKVGVAAV